MKWEDVKIGATVFAFRHTVSSDPYSIEPTKIVVAEKHEAANVRYFNSLGGQSYQADNVYATADEAMTARSVELRTDGLKRMEAADRSVSSAREQAIEIIERAALVKARAAKLLEDRLAASTAAPPAQAAPAVKFPDQIKLAS